MMDKYDIEPKGVSVDGCNTNTGEENGVLRRIEVAKNRPYQWMVCDLHTVELLFRKLFKTIGKLQILKGNHFIVSIMFLAQFA